ncbi:MAG TPA: Crp/Fnr family transcriptional regulator [Puia sp.]|nr:Crp/Fnr family transcriptional regulator [Puia sp.]
MSDDGKDICFIHSGVVKSEINGKNGKPLILRLAGKGAVFGHRNIANIDFPKQTVTAVENLHICKLSTADFRRIADKSPNLQSEIIHSYLDEMKNLEIRALDLAHKSVKQRIAGILLDISEIYQYSPGLKTIRINLSRQDLASLAGTTKEQVSTILAEFQKQKLLKFQAKHFKYFDLEGLRKI